MAAVTGAVIAAGTAAYSANQQKKAAQGAANAAADGQQLSIAEQQRQFDLTRQDMQPWMQAGQNALGQMQSLNSGDFSSFTQSPDYQFALEQGLQGLDRSAAARGSLNTGGHSADVLGYAQGLASQNYGNFYNRLAGLANVGQTTATSLGQFGANAASNIGNAYGNIGNARASSYQARGDANSQLGGILGGLAGGIANNWSAWQQPQQASQQNVWGALQSSNNPFQAPAAGNAWAGVGPSNGVNWNFGG